MSTGSEFKGGADRSVYTEQPLRVGLGAREVRDNPETHHGGRQCPCPASPAQSRAKPPEGLLAVLSGTLSRR